MDLALIIGLGGLILTIIVHLIGFVWWASNINTRISHIEAAYAANSGIGERMSALETGVKSLGRSLDNLNGSVTGIEQFLMKKGNRA